MFFSQDTNALFRSPFLFAHSNPRVQSWTHLRCLLNSSPESSIWGTDCVSWSFGEQSRQVELAYMSAVFHMGMASKFALSLSAVTLEHLGMLYFDISRASKSKLQGLLSVLRQASPLISSKTPGIYSHVETSRKYIFPFDKRSPKNQEKEMTTFP